MTRIAFILVTAFALALPFGASRAQDLPPAYFASYDDMRARLDELMTKRRIADLLTAFGGADEMAPQDMAGLETQVRNLFPRDFTESAVILRQDMLNGFAQELIAYWNDAGYIYVRVLWHQRGPGDLVSINMTFNSDVDVLLADF